MNYKEALNWLEGFTQFGIKLGLERIKALCEKLGNPQNNYKIIHVGGTNGKGSVCKYVSSILTKSGYKTGVYISPHLQKFTERIVIDGKEISEKEVTYIINKMRPIAEVMKKNGEPPTYFEIVTAMAFQYFYDKKIDFAVVEVGLGGRFDATNIVKPILSVITNVSLEHQKVLGDKIEDIAFEKAGIIKNNTPIITAAKGKAYGVIEKIGKEKNSSIKKINSSSWKRLENSDLSQKFYIKGFLKNYKINTSLKGKYQGENISLAVAVVESLKKQGINITEESIFDGIEKTFYPGRMEVLSYAPHILIDGAHNTGGIENLVETLDNDFKFDKLILIIGILSDKNIKEMLSLIVPLADIVITTKSKNERACNPLKLKKIIKLLNYNKKIIVSNQIKNAIKHAKSIAKENDLICITGSLYTIGEARNILINCMEKC